MAEFIVTTEMQTKLLAMMWEDREFGKQIASSLSPNLFSTRALQWFFTTITARPHSVATLKEELVSSIVDGTFAEDAIELLENTLESVLTPALATEKEFIRDKLDSFIKTQTMKLALPKMVNLAKEEKWDEIVETVTGAVKSGISLSDLGMDYFAEFQDRAMKRAEGDYEERVPTGVPELDALMTGGLKRGQMGFIMGGTGRGKSIFLSWLGRAAIMTGKNVLYVTLELSAQHIADRYDALFAQLDIAGLRHHQEDFVGRMAPLAKQFGRQLRVKQYPADGATVPMLASFLDLLSAHNLMPDVVIVDYLDLLASHRQYNSEYSETNAITKALVGLAAKYNVVLYTAGQLNRGGMVAETPDEASTSGYVGKLYAPDVVLALAQTNDERQAKKLRVVVVKNRNGEAGRVVPINTDYAKMTFYKPDLIALQEEEYEDPYLQEKQEQYENHQSQQDISSILHNIITGGT